MQSPVAVAHPGRGQLLEPLAYGQLRIGTLAVTLARPLEAGRPAGPPLADAVGFPSTDPKTPEGKARVVAAMVKGRRKWVERMKAEGKKLPSGRKRDAWVTAAMK
jgi:hypothetical protein